MSINIAAAGGVGLAFEKAGVVAVAGLAAAAIVGGSPRRRAIAMAGALALTPVLLVVDIWNTSQLQAVRGNPLVAVAGVLAGLAVVGALAVLLHRRPSALPLLAVAALPFRLPVAVGGATANLLIPLYVVVGAAGLAYAIPRLRGRPPGDGDGELPVGWLERALAGIVLVYAVQATYSAGFEKALENVVFFYVPFALLFVMLARLRWTARMVGGCAAIVVGLAFAFAAVGFYEYATRELLLNPKVLSANEFSSYFRVNSLFFDPNIYGRFLALVMVILGAALVWAARRRTVLLAGVGLAVLWAALVVTFSLSSIGALLAGLVVLAALRWDPRRTLAAAAAAVALGGAFVVAYPSALHVKLGSAASVNHVTSGRYNLIKGGLEVFADHPLAGAGSGSFQHAYAVRTGISRTQSVSASHTIPITIAAEQGAIGLAAYLALLVAALARLLPGARRSAARAYLAAAFVALILHTLVYAAFLEDPITWTLLGLGAALARVPVAGEAEEPQAGEAEPASPPTPAAQPA